MRRARIVGLVLAVTTAGAGGYAWLRAQSVVVKAPVPAKSAAPDTLAPGQVRDPLQPTARIEVDATRDAASAGWVERRPGFQSSRAAVERGGVEPCATQPFDASSLTAVLPLRMGKLTFPRALAMGEDPEFDLVIHLHGDEPIRRELAESGQPLALLTITRAPGEGYISVLGARRHYTNLLAEVEQASSRRFGRELRARKVALSAWSAGFGGIASALVQPEVEVDAVVLLDGLHAPRRDAAAFRAQLAPFVAFARGAAEGRGFMFISHSSIDSPDFASTTETAHYLMAELGGAPRAVLGEQRFGQKLVEYFSRGELHVRGYAGNDKADHCAQIALLRDVLRGLAQRWQTQSAK